MNDAVDLATSLTVAWLSNPHNRVSADDVPAFLQQMHSTVQGLASGSSAPAPAEEATYEPAVSVRKSLANPDHIVSMIDGKPYKTLKRHLATNGLTPAAYRERYGLKADYPMVAPAYSAARSETAKRVGLGRKPAAPAPAAETAPEAAPKAKRKPRGVAEAKAAAKAHLGGLEG